MKNEFETSTEIKESDESKVSQSLEDIKKELKDSFKSVPTQIFKTNQTNQIFNPKNNLSNYIKYSNYIIPNTFASCPEVNQEIYEFFRSLRIIHVNKNVSVNPLLFSENNVILDQISYDCTSLTCIEKLKQYYDSNNMTDFSMIFENRLLDWQMREKAYIRNLSDDLRKGLKEEILSKINSNLKRNSVSLFNYYIPNKIKAYSNKKDELKECYLDISSFENIEGDYPIIKQYVLNNMTTLNYEHYKITDNELGAAAKLFMALLGCAFEENIKTRYVTSIIGPGNDGKSTLFRCIGQYLGVNIVGTYEDDKTDNEVTTQIYNSRIVVNYDCQIPDKIVASSMIRKLSSRDPLQLNVKYERIRTVQTDAKIFILGNEVLTINISKRSQTSRFVGFRIREVNHNIPQVEDKIISELPYFIRDCIKLQREYINESKSAFKKEYDQILVNDQILNDSIKDYTVDFYDFLIKHKKDFFEKIRGTDDYNMDYTIVSCSYIKKLYKNHMNSLYAFNKSKLDIESYASILGYDISGKEIKTINGKSVRPMKLIDQHKFANFRADNDKSYTSTTDHITESEEYKVSMEYRK